MLWLLMPIVEFGGIFHSGQTSVSLRINTNELGLPQPTTPIKNDNYASEGIVAATIIKSPKEMYIRFYWMGY